MQPSASVAWFLTVIRELAIVIAVLVLAPTPGVAQSLVVSPRISVMAGHEAAVSAGLRAEVGGRLSLFGQVGVSQIGQECGSLIGPRRCSTPSNGGLDLLGGVRLTLPRIGPLRPAMSLGAGALLWEDFGAKSGVGSIWEAELRVGVRIASWSDLLLGAVVKSIGQSASGMILERDRGTYGGVVVGLLIPVL